MHSWAFTFQNDIEYLLGVSEGANVYKYLGFFFTAIVSVFSGKWTIMLWGYWVRLVESVLWTRDIDPLGQWSL